MSDFMTILGFIIADRIQSGAFKFGMQLGNELRQLVDSITGYSHSNDKLYERLASLLRNDSTLVKLQFVDCDDCGHIVAEAITKGKPTREQGIERIYLSAIVSWYSNKPICAACAQRRYSKKIYDWVNEQEDYGRCPPDEKEILEAIHRVSEVCLQL